MNIFFYKSYHYRSIPLYKNNTDADTESDRAITIYLYISAKTAKVNKRMRHSAILLTWHVLSADVTLYRLIHFSSYHGIVDFENIVSKEETLGVNIFSLSDTKSYHLIPTQIACKSYQNVHVKYFVW